MIPWNRILFPTDFSQNSRFAQEHACDLAERLGSELHVLHVCPDSSPLVPEAGLLLASPEVCAAEHIESTIRAMQRLFDAKWTDEKPVVWAVEEGDAPAAIIRYAEEHEINLIVLGTHGRTGLAHAFLGSVAERVLRRASCPVMAVRPPGHKPTT